MKTNREKIAAVPTNIITGFLGVGKTTAILNLLQHKPADERWAVLVNEFGEVGVDGQLFQGQHSEESGVYIREVPGGCMCCAAGLPMQMALNQLLMRARPDRLLIEPTGLGHPVEVLQSLSSEHYREVLSLQKIITLVDARKLADERYTSHPTFNQQIDIADILVGNKQDLCSQTDIDNLQVLARSKGFSGTSLLLVSQGAIVPEVLQGPTAASPATAHSHHHAHSTELIAEQPIPEVGYLSAVNEGEGFHSIGWRFAPGLVFSRSRLVTFLSRLVVERMKAVFITDCGIFGYNLTVDALTEVELDDCMESRIEIIAEQLDAGWEAQLRACVEE